VNEKMAEQPQQPQAQQQQKPPEKSSPFSFPVLALAIGGALFLMPWFGGIGGSFLVKLGLSAVGAVLLYVGFRTMK